MATQTEKKVSTLTCARAECAKKALFAKKALKLYFVTNNKEEDASVILDLLADLRHLCDELGLDFGEIDKFARRQYLAELESAGKEAKKP